MSTGGAGGNEPSLASIIARVPRAIIRQRRVVFSASLSFVIVASVMAGPVGAVAGWAPVTGGTLGSSGFATYGDVVAGGPASSISSVSIVGPASKEENGPPDHAKDDEGDESSEDTEDDEKEEKGPPDQAKNDKENESSEEKGPPDHAKNDDDDDENGYSKSSSAQGTADDTGPPDHAKNGDAAPPSQAKKDDAETRGLPEYGEAEPRAKVSFDRPVSVQVAAEPSERRGGPEETAGQDDGESEDGDQPSTVSVQVDGVDPGDHVEVDVRTEETVDDDVAFDGISTKVKSWGSFTMRVTSSREALPGSPAFDHDDSVEVLGRIRLEHSISNDDVEDVSFTFRVSKQRLEVTNVDAGDVALYRHADGSWTALSTKVIGETDTHYVLRAESPGMSEFAVGAKRPAFELWGAGVTMRMVEAGEPTEVFGRVTNVGGADGVYTARLKLDGETVATRHLTIAAGGTRQVSFEQPLVEPGEYDLYVNEVYAGTVTVAAQAEPRARGPGAFLLDWLTNLGLALGVFGLVTPATIGVFRSRRSG